jgi:hypothetical protein
LFLHFKLHCVDGLANEESRPRWKRMTLLLQSNRIVAAGGLCTKYD